MDSYFRPIAYVATMLATSAATPVLANDLSNASAVDLNNAKIAILKGYSNEQRASIGNYCLKFVQIPSQLVGSLIKEFESMGVSPEAYLRAPICQPRGYSEVIASPMIHAVADDPNKREETLNNIWLYYSKKRKQPEIFTELLNAKNTAGETLLDYFVTLTARNNYRVPAQFVAIATLVKLTCEHGGTYSTTLKQVNPLGTLNLNHAPDCITAYKQIVSALPSE